MSTRPIACVAGRSNEHSTKPTALASATCRWTRPIGWSPTRWKLIGTPSYALSTRRKRTTSGNVSRIGSSSTSKSASASWPLPRTSLGCGVPRARHSVSASGCWRSLSRMSP